MNTSDVMFWKHNNCALNPGKNLWLFSRTSSVTAMTSLRWFSPGQTPTMTSSLSRRRTSHYSWTISRPNRHRNAYNQRHRCSPLRSYCPNRCHAEWCFTHQCSLVNLQCWQVTHQCLVVTLQWLLVNLLCSRVNRQWAPAVTLQWLVVTPQCSRVNHQWAPVVTLQWLVVPHQCSRVNLHCSCQGNLIHNLKKCK